MSLFDFFKNKKNEYESPSYYDSLTYTKSCLNCMQGIDARYNYIWEGFSELVSDQDIYSREYFAMTGLRKELADNQTECPACGQVGMFDIWDIKLNGEVLYLPPSNDTPSTQFFLEKENGEIKGQYRPVVSGNNTTNLTMFTVAKTAIAAFPEWQFKSHDNGYVDIITYQRDPLNCATNRCRFAGFAYEEIIDFIDYFESEYRSKYMNK